MSLAGAGKAIGILVCNSASQRGYKWPCHIIQLRSSSFSPPTPPTLAALTIDSLRSPSPIALASRASSALLSDWNLIMRSGAAASTSSSLNCGMLYNFHFSHVLVFSAPRSAQTSVLRVRISFLMRPHLRTI